MEGLERRDVTQEFHEWENSTFAREHVCLAQRCAWKCRGDGTEVWGLLSKTLVEKSEGDMGRPG